MNEFQQLLERQARWQKTRQALSWPEKIQMAERIRESVRQLRAARKMKAIQQEQTPTSR
jgi:hypothetical protein